LLKFFGSGAPLDLAAALAAPEEPNSDPDTSDFEETQSKYSTTQVNPVDLADPAYTRDLSVNPKNEGFVELYRLVRDTVEPVVCTAALKYPVKSVTSTDVADLGDPARLTPSGQPEDIDDSDDYDESEDSQQGQSGAQGHNPSGDPDRNSDDDPEDPDESKDQSYTHNSKFQMDAVNQYNNHRAAQQARIDFCLRNLREHDNGTTLLTNITAQLMLDDMKELCKDLTASHTDCFTVYPDIKTNSTDPYTQRGIALNIFDSMYQEFIEARAKTTGLIKTMTAVTGTGLKLPKLALPTFKGIHTEWPAFKSAFIALVNDSTKFSPCEKLRLLKEALKGPAEDNVKDLQSTDGNWPIACDRLTARYDSPRKAAHAAVRPLWELPALMSQTGNWKSTNNWRLCALPKLKSLISN